MNWWQWLLLLLGVAVVSSIIPALIWVYAMGAVYGSAIRSAQGKGDDEVKP
jgi:hypothetical protein